MIYPGCCFGSMGKGRPAVANGALVLVASGFAAAVVGGWGAYRWGP